MLAGSIPVELYLCIWYYLRSGKYNLNCSSPVRGNGTLVVGYYIMMYVSCITQLYIEMMKYLEFFIIRIYFTDYWDMSNGVSSCSLSSLAAYFIYSTETITN